jgi:hypothetical protein
MAAMLGFADLLKYITSLPGVDATVGSTEVIIVTIVWLWISSRMSV